MALTGSCVCPTAPRLSPLGLDAVVVEFATRMSDAANRAALAFAAHIRGAGLPVREVSTALASVVLHFDPDATVLDGLVRRLETELAARDWSRAALPTGRRRWRVPTLYGAEAGPQLQEAASLAGMSPNQAVEALGATDVRVLALGFAPGQPYLGPLPDAWDIPRQTALTPRVPAGALVVAIRQIVVFANASPTGWRWIGLTALPLFDPARRPAALLAPADVVTFHPVSAREMDAARVAPLGGATAETLS